MSTSAERSKAWREKHPGYHTAYNASYYEKNKTALRTASDAYQKQNSEYLKARAAERHLKNKYGLSKEKYTELLEKQGNACAICRSTSPGRKGPFLVDHDHRTNELRGLLCHRCNAALGLFKDNPLVLEHAIKYLTTSTQKQDV